MADIITIEECITRLDVIRHEIVPDSRDHFALSAGIAALHEMEKDVPAVNRWISCEDELPEVGKPVLCYCRANIMCVLKWTGAEWYENPSHCYMSGFVTNWQYLPEPPEKE